MSLRLRSIFRYAGSSRGCPNLRLSPGTTRQNLITSPFKRGMAYDDRELYASLYSREVDERIERDKEKGKENFKKWSTVGDLGLSDSAIAALDASEFEKAIHAKFGSFPAGASMLESLRWRHLSAGRLRWGWRIYRTTYESDEDWTRFTKIFNKCLRMTLVELQGHDDHLRFMYWPVIEDKSALDGAPSQALRKHFLDWRNSDQPWQEAGLTKDIAPHLILYGAPTYDSFISIDEESLESVLRGNGAPGNAGYVNLVQANWPPSDDWERESIEADDGYDAIEGMASHDVGFQRVDLGYLYPDMFEETHELERELWYKRPPSIYPGSYPI